jgi:hypothetical protein
MVKTTRRERKYQRRTRRCKECRCKPCKCKEEIHCYKITCGKTRKRKNAHKRKPTKRVSQKGGFLPIAALGCAPCLAGPALGVAGLGTAGYMVSRSSSSKVVNGKANMTRKESYSLKKNGKKIKKVFEQKNNRIYLNRKEILPRPKNINQATKRLNQKIKECVESGFKKC